MLWVWVHMLRVLMPLLLCPLLRLLLRLVTLVGVLLVGLVGRPELLVLVRLMWPR